MSQRTRMFFSGWVGGILLAGVMIGGMTLAHAQDADLIQSIRSLRDSLPVDDPSRPQLTSRLADLLFDQGLELAHEQDVQGKPMEQLAQVRRETLGLYDELMAHSERIPLAQKSKIIFQMSRVRQDLGQNEQARAGFEQLLREAPQSEIRRESALRLAEMSEHGGSSLDAAKYYEQALTLCNGGDSCSYLHYRRAWLFKSQNQLSAAIAEMKLALVDSKGQPREESIRDWVSFFSEDGSDGKQALSEIDALSAKLRRPQLVQDLASAYFSNGNRAAGVRVLEIAQAREPSLKQQIRLLEEYYGFRDWDRFERTLGALEKGTLLKLDPNDRVESEKILKRLLVQLDGERTTNPARVASLKSATQVYLRIFPDSNDRIRMIEGWMAVETDSGEKLNQLVRWINSNQWKLTADEQIRLREMRAAIAQKETTLAQSSSVIIEEMRALQSLNPKKIREYRYHEARALYSQKNFDAALPIFVSLADPSQWEKPRSNPDNWAVQSQHLSLDIYNQKKDFTRLVAQSKVWLTLNLQDHAQDIKEIREIADQAEFEQAVALGETPQSLQLFRGFCEGGRFVPKSCENAKVLAVKLKDQGSLITVLKASQSGDLAGEYEAAGYFAEAAAQTEKSNSKPSVQEQLKVSLLFELAGEFESRDRVLRQVLKSPELKKPFPQVEPILLATLTELSNEGTWVSGVNASLLSLAWSPLAKQKLAHVLEAKGQGTKQTQQLVLSSKESLGSEWSRLVLDEVVAGIQAERKISFYGSRSKQKFEARVAAMKKVTTFAESYLNGADLRTRIRVLAILRNAQAQLAMEIMESPIPQGLDAATIAQVQASLQELSAPFAERSKGYDQMLKEQMTQVTQVAPQEETSAKAIAAEMDLKNLLESGLLVPAEKPVKTVQAVSVIRADLPAVHRLHQNPGDLLALEELKKFYSSQGLVRLEAYFAGRIQQLNHETKKGGEKS